MTKRLLITIDGKSYEVEVEELDGTPKKSKPSHSNSKKENNNIINRTESDLSKAFVSIDGEKIAAPIPGKVLAINVDVGDRVKNKDVLIILEAMKMEIEVSSSRDGIVKKIDVKEGDTVQAGDLLVVIE